LLAAAGCAAGQASSQSADSGSSPAHSTAVVERRTVTHVLRLHGSVEAENAAAVVVPRIMGQNLNALVVTRLVPNGTRVKAGDLLKITTAKIEKN
jgi:multidrug efflux pump subunit AcrA (membrane-fusion protein)